MSFIAPAAAATLAGACTFPCILIHRYTLESVFGKYDRLPLIARVSLASLTVSCGVLLSSVPLIKANGGTLIGVGDLLYQNSYLGKHYLLGIATERVVVYAGYLSFAAREGFLNRNTTAKILLLNIPERLLLYPLGITD